MCAILNVFAEEGPKPSPPGTQATTRAAHGLHGVAPRPPYPTLGAYMLGLGGMGLGFRVGYPKTKPYPNNLTPTCKFKQQPGYMDVTAARPKMGRR